MPVLSRRASALFFFLLLEQKMQSRTYLASLFWPDVPDIQAKKNLRNILPELRKELGDTLMVTSRSISIQKQNTFWCDLHVLQKLFSEVLEPTTESKIREMLTLCQGELLEGFFVPDAPFFEDWTTIQRHRVSQTIQDALYALAEQLLEKQAIDTGMQVIRRLLEIDPLSERGHRLIMRFLVEDGQKSAALKQHDQFQKLLMKELGVEPDAQTQSLVQEIRSGRLQGRLETYPGQASASVMTQIRQSEGQTSFIKHNLPAPLTSFIGREREIEELRTLLVEQKQRLITVNGLGGIGKTRLALTVARSFLPREEQQPGIHNQSPFSDGIYFVPLNATIADTNIVDNLAIAITDAMQHVRNSQSDPGQQLLSELRDKKRLLVLDNFEHLLAGVDFLLEILQHAPGVTLLVTSRQILDVQAEFIYTLDGLPVPPPEFDLSESFLFSGQKNPVRPLDLTTPPIQTTLETQSYAGVALFLERCRQNAKRDFPSDDELLHMLRICQFVEGLPLAIELAAAMTRQTSCSEVWQELSRGQATLATTYRDLPPRHRSLHAVFDHSWQLLTVPQQHGLAACSIFPESFTIDAGASVAEVAHDLLFLLADASLLQPTDSGRFEMHPLTRRYALEKLRTRPDQESAAQQRFAHYYANLVERDAGELLRSPQKFQLLQREFANIRMAWEFATQQLNMEILILLSEGLFLYYLFQGPMQEGRQMIQLALDAIRMATTEVTNPAAINQKQLERQASEHQTLYLLASGYTGQAFLSIFQSDEDEIHALAQQAMPLTERLNDQRLLSMLHFALAWTAKLQGDLESVERHHQIGVEHARAGKLDYLTAAHLAHWALAPAMQGKVSEALEMVNQGLQLLDTNGYSMLYGNLLSELSFIYLLAGELTLASNTTEQALQANQVVGSMLNVGYMYKRMALNAEAVGNYSEALAWAQRSIAHDITLNNLENQASSLLTSGRIRMQLADWQSAEADLAQALEIAESKNFAIHLIQAKIELGHLYAYSQLWQHAEEHYRAAIPLVTDKPTYIAAAEGGLAKVLLEQGRMAEGFTHAQIATTLLMTHPLEAQYDVIGAILRTFNVLCANQDRRDRPLLQHGLDHLLARAEKINDLKMRRSFLEKIPAHHFLYVLAQEHGLVKPHSP